MSPHRVQLPDVADLDVVDAKQVIRSVMRDLRSHMSPQQVTEFGEKFAERVMEFAGHTTTVALYASVNAEPSTWKALELLHEADLGILLPKLGPGLARMWAWYEGPERLTTDAPGRPLSPDSEPLDSSAVEQVGAIIVPALAIDNSGHRIGQGGGWYDRMLKQDVSGAKIGAMVYPWELVDIDLPFDAMDRTTQWAILPDELVELENTD